MITNPKSYIWFIIGNSQKLTVAPAVHYEHICDVPNDEAMPKQWEALLPAEIYYSSPAIASDNSIYFAVEIRDPANSAILGDELWHISAEGDLLKHPKINDLLGFES